ncbi:MAG TPA: hypothetical protein VFB32_09965 [Rudaea sp.]|nr:hypothetical protein [Rudaea sp.]
MMAPIGAFVFVPVFGCGSVLLAAFGLDAGVLGFVLPIAPGDAAVGLVIGLEFGLGLGFEFGLYPGAFACCELSVVVPAPDCEPVVPEVVPVFPPVLPPPVLCAHVPPAAASASVAAINVVILRFMIVLLRPADLKDA